MKPFDVIESFLTQYDINSLSLKYQIKNYKFSIKQAQSLKLNPKVKSLKIAKSTLNFSNLLVLTQL